MREGRNLLRPRGTPLLTGNAAILAAHDWELLGQCFRDSANIEILEIPLVFGRGMGYNANVLASQGPGQDRLPVRVGGEQP